jgi:hypothetical protein
MELKSNQASGVTGPKQELNPISDVSFCGIPPAMVSLPSLAAFFSDQDHPTNHKNIVLRNPAVL